MTTSPDPVSWERAKVILSDALNVPAPDREALVRARCAGDPVLCAQILGLLDLDDPDATRACEPGPADEFADLQPGTTIGGYVIVDRLGRGGMGQVFLGRDRDLHRKVALKCLLSSGSAARKDERELILNEARAAAAISHPNIAAVHHVIEHGERAFIVMEYVAGESLAATLRRERLPIDRVIAIGCQLAAALSAAHAQGVVHRDLKPGNIHITPDGGVKVIDFGVARAANSMMTTTVRVGSGPITRLAHGGTPPYMSPEQLIARAVDERSDIFSLGVVLFEMAAARRPFPETERANLVIAQAKGAPRADAVDPRVPKALADVIATALRIEADQRYQTAAELGAALRAVAPPSAPNVSLTRDRRRRAAARAAIAAPLAILGVGSIGFITTVGFNNTFGRSGDLARFGAEPWTASFAWGVLALFPTLFVMTLLAVAVLAVRFALRLLELVGPIGRAGRRVRARCRDAVVTLGFDRPTVLAQALAGLGIVVMALLLWRYADLIRAWAALFNSAPIERLLPMGPQNYGRHYYIIALDAMILGFGYGLFRVLRLRTLQGVDEGRGSVALLAGVIVVMVFMSQLPYRVMNHREFERVELSGQRCYITGQTAEEFLVLCPGSDPPRNRAVRRDDGALRRLGIIENVFDGVYPLKARIP